MEKREFNINKQNEQNWLTPPEIINSLGVFDLDPCSPETRPWDTALNHYSKQDDGLLMPWFGRVWCNPPYGKYMKMFMEKMALHGNGIGLTFARTETKAFQNYVFPFADSIMFIDKRINFYDINGIRSKSDGGAPSVLISYGENNCDAIEDSGIKGHHIYLKNKVFIIGVIKEPKTWRLIVETALIELDSECNLSVIYKKVVEVAPKRVSKSKFYKEKIRQTLGLYFNRVGNGTYKT